MPLTAHGKTMKKSFEKQYGKQGKGYFYGYLQKHPEMKKKIEKKT